MPFYTGYVEWRIDSLALTVIVVVVMAICTTVLAHRVTALVQAEVELGTEIRTHNLSRHEEFSKIENEIGQLQQQLKDQKDADEVRRKLIEELRELRAARTVK